MDTNRTSVRSKFEEEKKRIKMAPHSVPESASPSSTNVPLFADKHVKFVAGFAKVREKAGGRGEEEEVLKPMFLLIRSTFSLSTSSLDFFGEKKKLPRTEPPSRPSPRTTSASPASTGASRRSLSWASSKREGRGSTAGRSRPSSAPAPARAPRASLRSFRKTETKTKTRNLVLSASAAPSATTPTCSTRCRRSRSLP